MNPVVEHRLRALEFWDEYGQAAACKAFAVSKSTLYNWRKRLKAAAGNPAALMPGSRAPKRRRRSLWPSELAGAIRRLRELHPNTGKLPLTKLLTLWCAFRGLSLPSESAIGRIVAAAPDKMRFAPVRLGPRGQKKAVKRRKKAHRPSDLACDFLELFCCDAIVRVRDGCGVTCSCSSTRARASRSLWPAPATAPARPPRHCAASWPGSPTRYAGSSRTTARSSARILTTS